MVITLSIITDTLLKVALNTNKTGHHVIHHNWHIVESDIKHQYNSSPWCTFYNWQLVESGIKYH